MSKYLAEDMRNLLTLLDSILSGEMDEDNGVDADHYNHGYQAGFRGAGVGENPHDEGTVPHSDWIKGWEDGCREAGLIDCEPEA